jgi:hypothetical protein
MLKIEHTNVYGFESAIRGLRNPLNSWDKSDSHFEWEVGTLIIGDNDLALMRKLAKAGSSHAKYRRMINVTLDITAPLYWWKEFDTYKVGTVANSCSTMHKIHEKDFSFDDFSCECLTHPSRKILGEVIDLMNYYRAEFVTTGDKKDWLQMIQLLPTSYNQKRTVQLNYEVLVGMYRDRKNHKLTEWHTLCDWIKELPHSELITLEGL